MDRGTRALLACGIVGPLLFLAVFTIEGALRPGYSAMRHFVSTLALTERGIIQIASFLVTGVLLLVASVGWRRVLRGGRAGRAAPILLAMVGVGFLLAGAFVADPVLGYPPGVATPETYSTSSSVHGLGALLIVPGIGATAFVVARRFRDDWLPAWRWASVAVGIVVPVGFVAAGVLAGAGESGAISSPPVGLVQRVAAFSGLGWIALVSWRWAS